MWGWALPCVSIWKKCLIKGWLFPGKTYSNEFTEVQKSQSKTLSSFVAWNYYWNLLPFPMWWCVWERKRQRDRKRMHLGIIYLGFVQMESSLVQHSWIKLSWLAISPSDLPVAYLPQDFGYKHMLPRPVCHVFVCLPCVYCTCVYACSGVYGCTCGCKFIHVEFRYWYWVFSSVNSLTWIEPRTQQFG